MIEEQQWLALVGEQCKINYESLCQLQQDFVSLFSNRLCRGEEVLIPFVGKFERKLRKVFIAEVKESGKYIIPPRVELLLYKSEQGDWGVFGRVLKELSTLTPENVEAYLVAFERVVAESLARGESIEWKDLGTFSLSANSSLGYSFAPSPNLLQAVNKVFSFYEPTLLAEGKQFPQLEEYSFLSLDEALAQSPLIPLDKASPSTDSSEPRVLDLEQPIDNTAGEIVNEQVQSFSTMEQGVPDSSTLEEKQPPQMPPPLPSLPASSADVERNSTDEAPLAVTKAEQSFSSMPLAPPPLPTRVRRTSPRRRGFWYIVALALVLLLGLLFVLGQARSCSREPKRSSDNNSTKVERSSKESDTREAVASSYSKKDSIDTPQDLEKPKESLPEVPPKVEMPIQKVTITKGNTLTSIAKETYGHKAFWVYIYEENKAIIANPNNIALGTELTLPPPGKYAINAEDEASVARAKEKERELNKQFPHSSSSSPVKSEPRFPSRDDLYN